MSRPRIFIISGPSGSGKGTIVSDLRARHPDLFFSVSATTRPIREGMETDGVDYHFVSKETFEDLISRNEFIEYASYCGNYYGTPRTPVENALKAGRSVILEIETAGMQNAFAQYPDAVTVFIVPPSAEVLAQRLRGRRHEEEEVFRKRLAKAEEEMKLRDRYRYCIVNDEIDAARDEMDRIYRTETEG